MTLQSELEDLGRLLAQNLTTKGVISSYDEGLTTLANKILTVPSGGGGSCDYLEFDQTNYFGIMGTATLHLAVQSNYEPLSNATITLTGTDNSTQTATTDSNGVATFTVTGVVGNTVTYTASYNNITTTCTVEYINKLYAPLLDGTESPVTILNGYTFTTVNGVAGGGHQVGYVGDGFDNSGNWELTMTLTTSQWDGGFALLLNPYTSSDITCSKADWNCIFENGQADMLQWLDGSIKINQGSGLTATGMSYTRGTTMNVKMIKNGTTFQYYENNSLKGTYTWSKLNTAPRVYLGVFTWANSTTSSINSFTNVDANPI